MKDKLVIWLCAAWFLGAFSLGVAWALWGRPVLVEVTLGAVVAFAAWAWRASKVRFY